jgi:isochorismate pyruvate lyase
MPEKTIIPAENCETMVDVRAAIDDLDRQIVPLLAARCRYIEAAGRIKKDRDKIHDDSRIADVVAKALATAAQCHAPASVVEAAYRALIAASIDYEFVVFEQGSRKCEQG